MKILILNDAEDYALGASYTRAFHRLGHEVTLTDPAAELSRRVLWRTRLTRRLFERKIIANYNRQWIDELSRTSADMIWVGKGAWAVPWLWRELKRRRPEINLVCYNADNPITTFSRGANRPWITEAIPCFDLYCTYNLSLVGALRQAGAKQVVRIPFAWDPELHPDLEPSNEDQKRYGSDVIFIGNGDRHREKWMKEIIEAARPYGWRFAIYGDWARCRDHTILKLVRDRQIYGAAMVKAIRSAKTAINILRRQNEGSHNMRTFEIPGCGGVMISQRSLEQEEFFPNDQAAGYFNTAAEGVAKIRELIENETWRLQMRNAAHKIAHDHTYLHRAVRLLDAIANPSKQSQPK